MLGFSQKAYSHLQEAVKGDDKARRQDSAHHPHVLQVASCPVDP